MTAIRNAQYHRVEWEADLTDAPVVRMQYGITSFRPIRIHATYTRHDGQWAEDTVTISGPQHKKDGTDGVETRDNRYSLRHCHDDAPDWVRAIVLANVPREVTGR